MRLWFFIGMIFCASLCSAKSTQIDNHFPDIETKKQSKNLPFNSETWMRDWADYIGEKTLRDINIPGAHDAATSKITWKSKIAPAEDLPEALNNLRYAGVGFAINKIIAKWAKAQDHSIRELLDCGIRYLDLRITPKNKSKKKIAQVREFAMNKLHGLFGQLNNEPAEKVNSTPEYYSVHGLYGESLKGILADVRAFLDQNPDEFIILDFQKITGGINKYLYASIVAALGEERIGTVEDLSHTLNELWEGKKRIFIFVKQDSENSALCLSRNDHLESHWPNASTAKEFNEKMRPYFKQFSKTKMTAIQAQLTPDNNSIIESLKPFTKAPDDLKRLWKNWEGAVLSNLAEWYNITGGAIVQGDFVDANFAQKVVELNAS